jgi:hypothetical protein
LASYLHSQGSKVQSDVWELKTLFYCRIFSEGIVSERPDFPTLEQAETASHEQLARWYRFLPSGNTPEQQKVMEKIVKRFKALGGMTPEISKRIGFGGTE